MLLSRKNRECSCVFVLGLITVLMAFLVSGWFCGSVSARMGGFGAPTIWPSDAYKKDQDTYMSLEGAVDALVDALSTNDEEKLLAVLGPEGKKLFFSDGGVDERAARERFIRAYHEKNRIIKVGSKTAVLEIGNEDLPFPVPIEKVGKRWSFSAKQGKVELLKPPDRQQ